MYGVCPWWMGDFLIDLAVDTSAVMAVLLKEAGCC